MGSFLADDSIGGGSWADEEVDLTSIGVPTSSTAAVPERSYQTANSYSNEGQDSRPERKEYPVPDHPPFRAKVSNLPWDVNENDVAQFFEKRMQMNEIITDVKLPEENGRLKGFGFVTFSEKNLLEEALRLSTADFNGRRIFVNVAAPQKADVFDLDWRSSRTGPLGGRGGREGGREFREGGREFREGGMRREEPDLDWGAARTEASTLSPRNDRRPSRRQEAEFEWGTARTDDTNLPPRERGERLNRGPRKPEPEFDWGSARTEEVKLPPRQPPINRRVSRKQDPDFDWGSARTDETKLPPRQPSNRKPSAKKNEPELDWGTARTEAVTLPPRSRNASARSKPANTAAAATEKEDKIQGPQKSAFDVLAIEGDSDEEDSKKPEPKQVEETKIENIVNKTADLSIGNESEDGWNVVHK